MTFASLFRETEPSDMKKVSHKANIKLAFTSIQTHQADSTLKRRGNGRFHVVSTWNPRGVFVGLLVLILAIPLLSYSQMFLNGMTNFVF